MQPVTLVTRLPDGRLLTQNQEVSHETLRGRYRFTGLIAADGSLAVYGGPAGRERNRYIRPQDIKTIHRIAKRRGA